MLYKFGSWREGAWVRHLYGNRFGHEVYPEWSRVTIGPNDNHIPLMLEIAKQWQGPYAILYVLKLPRMAHEAARYQSPEPCCFEDLEHFACSFLEYFERDGRHHVWFADVASRSQLVYDNHDLIYSYGMDDEVIALLKAKGFVAGDVSVPCPHEHRYNEEFDKSEDEIMTYCDWIPSPLQQQHDDP